MSTALRFSFAFVIALLRFSLLSGEGTLPSSSSSFSSSLPNYTVPYAPSSPRNRHHRSRYVYPYHGRLRRACKSTPSETFINDILDTVGLHPAESLEMLHHYYQRFFTTINPGVRLFMKEDQPILFVQHRQAGADTINDNLRHITNASVGVTSDVFDREEKFEKKYGARTLKALLKLLRSNVKPEEYVRVIKKTPIFTFVIDPIERFLFAVNECYLRNVLPHSLEWKNHRQEHIKRRFTAFSSVNQVNESLAKAIIDAILSGDNDVIKEHLLIIPSVSHYFPMSNMLAEFEPAFVGDFSKFEDEWHHVEELYKKRLPLLYPSYHDKYYHLGRLDSLGLVKAMRSVLNNTFYASALCKLYIRDYACFRIPLPSACDPSLVFSVGRQSFSPPD